MGCLLSKNLAVSLDSKLCILFSQNLMDEQLTYICILFAKIFPARFEHVKADLGMQVYTYHLIGDSSLNANVCIHCFQSLPSYVPT
jgi:hypothetical protein